MRCDPAILWTLVEQTDEPSDDAKRIFAHVERCPQCQATLRSIGGNESWWSDAQQWLGEQPREPASAAPDKPTAPATASDLAFLQSPGHPEMLGRMGRYDIEGVIGRGGMGIVFRGFDSDLQRCVAIKTLSPRYGCDANARQRFAREAQAAASVVHENVIPIFNVQADHDPPFLVMPYVAGATLERFVAQYGPPDAITVLRIARQIAAGLQAAHQQDLIHRDIKPGNILVTENVHRVCITDFGLARAVDDATLTHTGVIAGTPQFMSPEQSRGERLDARSDLFSFGSLLYFLSTGRAPFEAESTLAVLHQVVSSEPPPLAAARPDLPPAFVSLVDDLLRKDPSQRPRNAEAVAGRISLAVAQRSSGLSLDTVQRRRRWVQLAVVSLAAVLLISLATASLPLLRHTGSAAVTTQPPSGASAAVASPAQRRLLAPMVQRIDRQLSHPEADAAVARAAQSLAQLAHRSPMLPELSVDLQRAITARDQGKVTAIDHAMKQLQQTDAEPWTQVAANPTRRWDADAERMRRQLRRLQSVQELFP